MNRREFVRSSAIAGGGLLLSFHATAVQGFAEPGLERESALGDFVTITPNGDVLFQFVKHEMGQGISTAMPQIFADELCADWEKVKIGFPDADMKKYQNERNGGHDTGGSCTIIYQWDMLRKAGATARQLLIEAAAKRWSTSASNCYAENHFVKNKNSSQKLGFGALAEMAAQQDLPKSVQLKDPVSFQLIGKPKVAKLIPSMVRGNLQYGLDVKVPGMVYAVIKRCPVFKGKLKNFDASEALKVNGVKKYFQRSPLRACKSTHRICHTISGKE